MDYPKTVPGVGLVNGKFVDEDATTGQIGSLIPSKWGNLISDELLAILALAGIAPNENVSDQVATAIRALMQVQASNYGVDVGVANVYAATFGPAVTALTNGMRLRIKVKTTNTGASTFAPDAIAAKPIWGGNHQALQGGELVVGGIATLEWNAALNSGAGVWVLIQCSGGALQVAPAATSQQAVTLGQFLSSLSAYGSIRIPVLVGSVVRSLIVNWGSFAGSGSGDTPVTFNTAFPNAFFLAVVSGQCSGTGAWGGYNSATLSGMNGNWWSASGTRQSGNATYIALGW